MHFNIFFNSEDYMAAARSEANKSKDNETKVGAVIVNIKNKIIGTGYNCMPMGRNDDNENFPWLARKMARPNDKYGIASEHKHLYGIYFSFNGKTYIASKLFQSATRN